MEGGGDKVGGHLDNGSGDFDEDDDDSIGNNIKSKWTIVTTIRLVGARSSHAVAEVSLR